VGAIASLHSPETQCNRLSTTAAAGKVYRSNRLQARQAFRCRRDACLEWLLKQLCLMVQFTDNLRIELSPGARWLGWEITRLGRVPGEKGFAGGVAIAH